MKKLSIWWTDQSDCEAVTEEQLAPLPEYIKEQFESRFGRSGRGRLWVDETVEPSIPNGIVWDTNSKVIDYCNDAAGLVVFAEHTELVKALPGIVTDTAMVQI